MTALLRHAANVHMVTVDVPGTQVIPSIENQRNDMQGEKIAEQLGKVTARRVLPNPGGPPKMEVSFQAETTLLGVSHCVSFWHFGDGEEA